MKRNHQKANYKLRVRGELRAKVLSYLSSHPCVDCMEADPIVLEFDHVRDTKVSSISKMVNDCKKWTLIEKEITKCEVRCANCHRRKTALQLGFWKQFS